MVQMDTEKFFLKVPTYVDGTPLKVRDVILFKCKSSETAPLPPDTPTKGRVTEFYVKNTGHFVIYGITLDGNNRVLRMKLKKGSCVEAPAVVDNEGVPICVGDTVYGISDYKKWVVESIDYGSSHPVNCGGRQLKAKWCTHKKPPYGADEKLIKVKDIVYTPGSVSKFQVQKVVPASEGYTAYAVDKFSEEPKEFSVSELTHTCLDSMSSIYEDASMDSQEYVAKYCKSEVPVSVYPDEELYTSLKIQHLLRRQRNLLEFFESLRTKDE